MDKLTIQSQNEHLMLKTPGTGHPDISKFEWVQNQHRDMLASFIGHDHLTVMMAVAKNQSRARTRYELLMKMIRPIGEDPHA